MARAKLELIKPDEVNMEEYEVSEMFLNQGRLCSEFNCESQFLA